MNSNLINKNYSRNILISGNEIINKAKEYNKKGPVKDGNSESLQIG